MVDDHFPLLFPVRCARSGRCIIAQERDHEEMHDVMVFPNSSGGPYKRKEPAAIVIKQLDIPIDTAHFNRLDETEYYEGLEY